VPTVEKKPDNEEIMKRLCQKRAQETVTLARLPTGDVENVASCRHRPAFEPVRNRRERLVVKKTMATNP
jgi:hypothetical protein